MGQLQRPGLGACATEKTHPRLVAVVPGSLSAIANASWVDF
jgi:hypothetical protein